MMLGNAAAGVVVLAANAAARLAVGGKDTVPELRASARIFFSLLTASSAGCVWVYRELVKVRLGLGLPRARAGAEPCAATNNITRGLLLYV
jgi:hypothetical protein